MTARGRTRPLSAAFLVLPAVLALAVSAPCGEAETGTAEGTAPEARPAEEAPPAARPPEKLRTIRELLKLRGRDYREARNAILGTVKAEDLLAVREAARADEDLALRIECDALVWRLGNPKAAKLLDEHAGAPTGGRARPSASSGGAALWGSRDAAQVLVSCFGQAALPALVELVLYEERPAAERLTLIEALVELRDAQTPHVLLAAAGETGAGSDPRVRAAAVWRLEKCLSGVPELSMAHAAGKDPLGLGPTVTPELANLAKPVKLPALELKGAERDRVVAGLGRLLGSDRDERVRALAAKALRGGEDAATGLLVRSLSADSSPWVRAWCADTLRRLGTPEARQAVEAAKGTEKNAEVLGILGGHGVPALPEQGMPGESILRGR